MMPLVGNELFYGVMQTLLPYSSGITTSRVTGVTENDRPRMPAKVLAVLRRLLLTAWVRIRYGRGSW